VALDIAKSSFEIRFGFLVTPVKLFEYEIELVIDLFFGQGADAPDDAQHAVIPRWLERSQNDTLFVRGKYDSGSLN
jgi:hypothetical protein